MTDNEATRPAKFAVLLLALAALAALVAACKTSRPVRGQESQPEGEAAPVAAEPAEDDRLAAAAFQVIRDNCWGCHGEPGKQAFGETAPIDWILDYDKLIETMTVVPGSAARSRLIYIVAVEGKMPREFDEDGMPSIEGELAEEDLQTLIDWVKAGAPRWPEPDSRN